MVKRYSLHGEFCPDDCLVNVEASDLVELHEDIDANWKLLPSTLEAMEVGEQFYGVCLGHVIFTVVREKDG